MNNNINWSETQWKAYENAEVWIKVTLLEKLILAAEAHQWNTSVSKLQKQCWKDNAKTALALIDKKKEAI